METLNLNLRWTGLNDSVCNLIMQDVGKLTLLCDLSLDIGDNTETLSEKGIIDFGRQV